MEDDKLLKNENILDISISKEMETSFIDYAMSVIVSRAIPDARDGLKPVHRRILFAMNGLDMIHNKSFKKSARAVGEVIAKYHPHGDSAVYDSLVRMAQPFSLRYPLVWGQGNFGSIDGDSAAAMRYTEAKLQKITSLMLEDIKKETVEFQENYDGSEIEPKVLPGKLPNLLVNGSVGIAVGMATSIPPHNLTEIINASKALLMNDDLDIKDLMHYVKAPDFPTGGIIINKNEIFNSYETGKGRIIIRSKTEIIFNEEKNFGTIIITEIPYMVNKSNLIIKIADLVKSKIIDSISDIKDESSRKGIRIVIKLKRGFIAEVELNKLFKLTALQSNFPINMVALVNERPLTLNLKDAIKTYNNHQIDVLVKKTKFNLIKTESRKHILDGLSIALDNIDDIIKIIKKSKENSEAQSNLINKFNFSEEQTKAILDMRLGRLTSLERENILDEIKKLVEMINDYNLILNNKNEQINRIILMLNEILEEYGDSRLTEISNENSTLIDDEDLIPEENVVVTISGKGYIKRIPIEEYRIQNRGGFGSRGATTVENDYIQNIIITNTHKDLLFFTSFGKVFRIRAHQIPQLSKTAKGLPIVNLIKIDPHEQVRAIISLDNYHMDDLIMITENGIIKKIAAFEFERINRNGKIAITLKENDHLLGVKLIPSESRKINTEIILGNSNGKAIRFNSSDVRLMGRSASGVRGMNVDGGKIVDYASSNNGHQIISISEKGFGKITDLENYRITKRGGKGVITINTNKAGSLIGLTAVKEDEGIMIITDKGTVIRIEISQISQVSRNSKGVTIVKLKEEEKITSVATVRSYDDIESEIIEKTKESFINLKDNFEKEDIK